MITSTEEQLNQRRALAFSAWRTANPNLPEAAFERRWAEQSQSEHRAAARDAESINRRGELRRSEMAPAEKARFVTEHGLQAFQDLPY